MTERADPQLDPREHLVGEAVHDAVDQDADQTVDERVDQAVDDAVDERVDQAVDDAVDEAGRNATLPRIATVLARAAGDVPGHACSVKGFDATTSRR